MKFRVTRVEPDRIPAHSGEAIRLLPHAWRVDTPDGACAAFPSWDEAYRSAFMNARWRVEDHGQPQP